MKPKIIVLECPIDWVRHKQDGDRASIFFSNILVAVTTLGIPIIVRPIVFSTEFLPRGGYLGELVFSYHSCLTLDKRKSGKYEPNVYRLKEASVPPYFSIDSLGYSGWSSVADSSRYKEEIEKIPIEEAEGIISKIRESFLTNKLSKYQQKKVPIPFLDKKYVFFPLQVQNDSVHQLNHLEAIDVIIEAAKIAREKKMLLVIKRHPFDRSQVIQELLQSFSSDPWVRISEGNIHDLNSHAHSVISMNSGTSLEAMIVGASVWNAGKAEWWDAVNHINKLDDVRKAFDSTQPLQTEYQRKLIAFLFKTFWVKNTDLDGIQRRIEKILDEYDKLPLINDKNSNISDINHNSLPYVKLWQSIDRQDKDIRLKKLYVRYFFTKVRSKFWNVTVSGLGKIKKIYKNQVRKKR